MTMKYCNVKKRGRSQQQGVTLVMALIILVLIMMIGIAAMNSSGTQFKLAVNAQFEDVAMNNAELAVTSAETWLQQNDGTNNWNGGFTTYSSGSTPQLYPIGATNTAVVSPLSATYSSANALCVDAACVSSYTIQRLSVGNSLMGSSQTVGGRATTVCNKVNTYQIVGRGIGAQGAVKTVVSYYSVLGCPIS